MTGLLTTAEAAAFLALKKNTLEIWRVQGSGPAFIKLGGAVRYKASDLENFIASRTKASTSQEVKGHAA